MNSNLELEKIESIVNDFLDLCSRVKFRVKNNSNISPYSITSSFEVEKFVSNEVKKFLSKGVE